jgi:hypothetical protein
MIKTPFLVLFFIISLLTSSVVAQNEQLNLRHGIRTIHVPAALVHARLPCCG